jgi:myosin-crossreactive antigen|tara:strand:+ start:277 stop:597 length:321 start_codon:yes stop_codon:yes gene_type:complete
MPIEKEIYSAKNDLIIDLGIAIEEAYQEALKNGFEGSKDDFIRTAPKSLLRKFINKGGRVMENSYEQLIDDYDNGIRVLTIDGNRESLTDYIIRMGGVDHAQTPKE